MDIFNVILLLVILILIISNKSSLNRKLTDLEFRLLELQNLLKQRDKPAKPLETVNEVVEKPVPVPIPPPLKFPDPPKPPEKKPEPVLELRNEVIEDSISQTRKPVNYWDQPISKPPKLEEPKPSFFERNPDLEKFIGENLVNKIGIAILVLAIGFFVKYAIDNNWIGPVGRVGIGFLCGGILVAFAHRLRKGYKAFSSVLAGGGMAIFYFTITLAYQEFHLFSQPVALAVMIGITVFAVALALLYDKQELAVIALIGGFASPFLLNNGSANYSGLFIYLLILNVGLLILAYFKAWRVLNVLSYIFSVLVIAVILFTLPSSANQTGFIFISIFYILFFTINIINNVRENKTFLAIDFTILLTNTALYFGTGLYLLTELKLPEYRGLFSAALGFLNLVLSYILFKNRKVDPNILYLLIGITLTFISLTAPIQLHGNNITLFWASETVLLYWLYQKSAIKLMQLTSLLIWVAMIISLIIDLSNTYSFAHVHLTIIANKGFITTICSAISSYILYILLKKDDKAEIYGMPIYKNLYRISALVLLFFSGIFEINHQFGYYFPNTHINLLYLMLYVPAFVFILNLITSKISGEHFAWQVAIAFLAITITVYLFVSPMIFDLLADMLQKPKTDTLHLFAHWLSDLIVILLFYQLVSICYEYLDDEYNTAAIWITTVGVVTFLSLEFSLMSNQLFYSKVNTIDIIETVYIKTALPVLWGLISFTLMWLGMRNKKRVLRIISLTLFSITLVKLFMFDINNIPVAGKIAAFFCLGVLLLIISFMYQKVKKIIVADEVKPKDE